MKSIFLSIFVFAAIAVQAQYYYKDIIGTRESANLIKTYQKAGVTRVSVNSYDADNTRDDDFLITQTFSKPHIALRTVTRNGTAGESVLTSLADADGRVVKTIDSSANLTSISEYSYDEAGRLQSIKSSSTDTSKAITQTEAHLWQWANGQPFRMLRIINNTDTSIVDFKLDGGNIADERTTRRGVKTDSVYYYYDAQNRLTDIVRFNNKAKRLLPAYMFEYSADGNLIQKITVPSNSSEYLIWRYQYNADGLKIKEAIYDRHKTLNGKIEYQYDRN